MDASTYQVRDAMEELRRVVELFGREQRVVQPIRDAIEFLDRQLYFTNSVILELNDRVTWLEQRLNAQS